MRRFSVGAFLILSTALASSAAQAQYYGGQTYYSNPYYKRPMEVPTANGEDLLNQSTRTSRNQRAEYMDYQAMQTRAPSAFFVNAGVRQDELKWNIASDITGTATPNILSELAWDNMTIYEIGGGMRYTLNKGTFRNFYIEAEGYTGTIDEGDNQDSDYNGNNRTLEFSRSNNNGSGGTVLGGQFGMGYTFALSRYPDATSGGNRYSLTPVVGYSVHQQNMEITDGNQTIPAFGAFAGLNSTYETSWHGPYVGARLQVDLANKHRFWLSGDYQISTYYAEADWNLRPDFQHPKSYEHEADGGGYQIQGEYGYTFFKNWELFLSFAFRDFSAEDGIDRTFFSNGAVGTTRFNQVDWTSQSYKLGVSYKF